MGAVDLPRLKLKREEYNRTKHDSDFSKWQVLIGPTDWEDYSLGKEGVEKYRFHNLPSASGPGLYELGIAVPSSRSGREIDPGGVVVVYLGQADNVRARLQCYGRSGAHLGNCYSTAYPNDSNLQKGTTLFEEIFSRGSSIVFRWAPMKTKRDAEITEARRLGIFYFAWNKGGNGACRPDDILRKVDEISSRTSKFSHIHWKLRPFTQKQVGIKIEGNRPRSLENNPGAYADEENNNFLSGIFKFSRSRPRLVPDNCGAYEDSIPICGVILNEGTSCRRPPVPGNKRCKEHKAKKIYGFSSKSTTEGQSHYVPDVYLDSSTCNDQKYDIVCGVNLPDGTFCGRQPVVGSIRCEVHKGMRVDGIVSKSATRSQVPALSWGVGTSNDQMHNYTSSTVSKDFTTMCGATLVNGSFCKRQPDEGNKRCWQHKGRRVDEIVSKSATRSQVPAISWGVGTSNDQMHNYTSSTVSKDFTNMCGATLVNGSFCIRQPDEGNKRCWQHKGRRVDEIVSKSATKSQVPAISLGVSTSNDQMHNYTTSTVSKDFTTMCGATLVNGSFCTRQPDERNKRCWQHKGGRVDFSSSKIDSSFSRFDAQMSFVTCGVTLKNGSACMRAPAHGNKRCAQHKGKRVSTW